MSNFNKFIRVVRWPSISIYIIVWFIRGYTEFKFTGFIDKIINSTDYIPIDIIVIIFLPFSMAGCFLYSSGPSEKPKKGRDLLSNIWKKDKIYVLITMIGVIGTIIIDIISQ